MASASQLKWHQRLQKSLTKGDYPKLWDTILREKGITHENGSVDAPLKQWGGSTLLTRAADYGRVRVVRLLIERYHADPTRVDNKVLDLCQ